MRNSVLEEGHGFSRAVNDTAYWALAPEVRFFYPYELSARR